ncbi:MAG: preprotein translocase subunit YajC [Sphingomonadales bacterium]|nr:preprotein translocase subunit YajC [Sphingomonadales bacterium]
MVPVTALATMAALAGPVLLAPSALAQNRPFAQSGAYENVQQGDVAGGVVSTGYDAQRQFDDVHEQDVTQLNISPDLPHSADTATDNTTDVAAREALDRQRQSEYNARKLRRSSERFATSGSDRDQRALWIVPYIEASQSFDSQISPSGDTLTYSVLAAGADIGANTNGYQGTLSLRYERRIGWGRAESYSNVSGIGRVAIAVVPRVLTMEVAGYANRVHVDGQGATTNSIGSPDSLAQVYSVMAGPSLATDAGDLEIKGHYRIGYSHVGNPTQLAVVPGQTRADIFDHSTVQDAHLRVGVQPGDVTPVGLAVEGGHYRETISNLDQQAHDSHVRGEVTIPVVDHMALVGGVGYEWTDVTSRDALRDSAGNPVINSKGRLLTDYAGPRYIAFQTEGLIWDAGVLWRPSSRTYLEAHVGRRYGEFGGYGSFSYRPTPRSSFNILVYNNLTSFGGMMTNALGNTPTQFTSIRDTITGNVGACVNGGGGGGGGCLAGSLATVRGTVFRGRGANAYYAWGWDRYTASVGVGYDRREFIAAPGTALALLNGKSEEYYWTAANIGMQVDHQTTIGGQIDGFWYRGNTAADSNFTAVRAAGVYQHQFNRHLSASAALGVDGINRKALDDVWTMSGQVGMRYTF